MKGKLLIALVTAGVATTIAVMAESFLVGADPIAAWVSPGQQDAGALRCWSCDHDPSFAPHAERIRDGQ